MHVPTTKWCQKKEMMQTVAHNQSQLQHQHKFSAHQVVRDKPSFGSLANRRLLITSSHDLEWMWYHNCGRVNLGSSWMLTTPAFRGFFTLHLSRLEQSPHYDSCQLSGFVADLLWSPMTLVLKLFLGLLLSQKQSSLSWYIIVLSWIAGLRLPPHCGCTTKLCVTSNYNPGKNENDIVCGRNSIRNAKKIVQIGLKKIPPHSRLFALVSFYSYSKTTPPALWFPQQALGIAANCLHQSTKGRYVALDWFWLLLFVKVCFGAPRKLR